MRKLLFITILFLVIKPTFGQNKIEGKVTDSINNPLPFVNIVLLKSDNNSILDGTITDEEGVFYFDNLEKGKYSLELSYLGFKTIRKEIDLTETTYKETFVLEEESNQLDVVVISTKKKKPLMEMKIDRTIFNISQSSAAIGGNTIDALKVTPGLKISDANSEIEMVGKGAVKLMINNKEIRLEGKSVFEYLKSIPSDQIESIEMITNPPSKYTAEGSYGIINLKLKKGAQDNFYGVISGSVRKSEKWTNSENVSVFYHKNKLQLNTGANYFDYRKINATQQNFHYSDYTLYEKGDLHSKYQGFGGFVETEYELSKSTSIGVNARLSYVPESPISGKTRDRYMAREIQTDSLLQTTFQQEQKNINQDYSFYLEHIIDSSGSKLSGEASYADFKKMRNENSITENKETQNGFDLGSDNDQRVKLFYASLDIELNRNFADYSFGLQFNDSKSKNVADYTNPNLVNQNSRFNYKETTYSAYLSGAKEFDKKWSLKLGLRSEYTSAEGNSLSLNKVTKRNHFELFPTAYLNYKVNSDNSFTLSYGRRIERPPYRILDPFRQYASQYSYSEGNPYLRPAYNNNFELKHLYKNKLSSALYFSYIPNGYSDIEVVSEDSHYIANEYDNYLKTYKFGITESYEWIPFSWWESNNTTQAYYSKSTSNNPNTLDKLSGFGAYFQTNNNLQFNKEKTLRANLSFTYYTPEVNGVYKDETYYFLDLGITALFFDEDLTLTLSTDDIFKSAIYKRTSNINGISQYFEGYYGSRSINFSASYKFGNSKNQNKREVYDENKERID